MSYNQSDSSNPLPIEEYRKSILYSLETHRVLLIVGETGSGKSTKIPEFLYSTGVYNGAAEGKKPKTICITQPRRVAAIQLAQRVAHDLRCNVGSTVGYAIRFKDVTDEQQTMVKFVTEGLLIREMLADPLLERYSVIMIDEVHERNSNTDILLGLLKCLMMKRKDLKLIICSATLDIDDLHKFFSLSDQPAPAVLHVKGKTYPLRYFYKNEPVPNYMDASVETTISIHEACRHASGKILIFLTGQDEVEYVCDKLNDYVMSTSSRRDLKRLVILPLFASLPPEEISKVFEEHGRDTRVCIVSTNVAETSLTINGVAFVIDAGFTKLKFYDHRTGVDSLIRVPISKSSARQRAGRAGRTREGIVYRLYPESQYDALEDHPTPEIQRSSLVENVMLLKSLGVDDPQGFPLMSPMPKNNLVAAFELLYALKAVDESGTLTKIGEKMSQLNLDPRLSKILVSPDTNHCTIETCKVVAMLQVKDIFVKQTRYASSLWSNQNLTNICTSEGDMTSYLNILNGFLNNQKSQKWAERRNLNYQALLNASDIASKLQHQLKRMGISLLSSNGRTEIIQKSLVVGLFSNAAYLHPSGDYKTIRGDQIINIHPTSVLSEIVEQPEYVVFGEILHTTKVYMRHIMSIEREWLLEAAPHFYTFTTNLEMLRDKC